MNGFRFSYHNVDLDIIKKKLDDNKKKIDEINKILSNESSLIISNKTTDLNDIKDVANKLFETKNTFVVLGIGGSNLGARALINILQGNCDKEIFFIDNIDPIQFSNSISKFNINRTGFIIISKSGSTPETLSQFSSIIEIIKLNNFSQECLKDFVVVTENKESPLKKI